MEKPPNMTRFIAYFPPEMLEEIQRFADKEGISGKAQAIRQLIRFALDEKAGARRSGIPAEALAVIEAYRKKHKLKTLEQAIKRMDTVATASETAEEPAPPVEPPKKKRGGLFSF